MCRGLSVLMWYKSIDIYNLCDISVDIFVFALCSLPAEASYLCISPIILHCVFVTEMCLLVDFLVLIYSHSIT